MTAVDNFLADDPAAAVSYAVGVSGDGGQCVAAMNHLRSVLEEWRVQAVTNQPEQSARKRE